MKLYIAVLDEFPDQMTPTLVAHSMLGAHLLFEAEPVYQHWLKNSFKKCTVRVNQIDNPNVLKFAKLWKPKTDETSDKS